MKKIVLISYFFICQVYADITTSYAYTSFMELVVNKEQFVKKEIAINGYLQKDENILFLCFSRNICLSDGKERLIVVFNEESSDGVKSSDVLKHNNCYVQLEGFFKPLPANTNLNFIGHIYIKSSPNITSRESYEQCKKL